MNKPWQLYEQIPSIDYIYMAGIMKNFTLLSNFGISNACKEGLLIMEHSNCSFYFHKDEFEKTQQDILKRVLTHPVWGIRFNEKLTRSIDNYFAIAKKVAKTNLSSLSDQNLIKLWQELYRAKEISHAAGVITTWIIDVPPQPFTKYLMNYLGKLIKARKLKLETPHVFSIVTSPIQHSYAQEEEIDIFKALIEIRKKPNLAKKKATELAKKYGWIYYKYLGPAKTEKDYLAIFRDLQKQNINPEKKIEEIAKKKKELIKQQRKLFSLLKPDKKHKKILQFAQQIVFLKDCRKMSQFYGSFINEKILKEVANRLGITLKQVRYFLPWEIEKALLEKKFDPKELSKRSEFSAYYTKGEKYRIFVNNQAHLFLKKQKFHRIKKKIEKLEGACACPGQVSSIVKIINLPEEIGKIKPGEIMISHATYPALVPAMKKASAIVTDEGGLTCHAAIVSRELGIPCVVGTKIATKVFKDGDKIEVDANKGIVRKI
jgi:phosphohistidine swiveling domain-containing protein